MERDCICALAALFEDSSATRGPWKVFYRRAAPGCTTRSSRFPQATGYHRLLACSEAVTWFVVFGLVAWLKSPFLCASHSCNRSDEPDHEQLCYPHFSKASLPKLPRSESSRLTSSHALVPFGRPFEDVEEH
ncbi:hypothetical protein LY78DRAFT_342576 [Colletotrichum sublineola]|nr:hypothetical protein LY78DRAFT_342576 [Colletotrichum sublineola]